MDSDDEVRDRATFYMNVLQQKQKALNAAYIFNGEGLQLFWISKILYCVSGIAFGLIELM